MWIKTNNDNLKKFYHAKYMDEPIEFSSNGKAQVDSKTGRKLVANFGAFTAVETTHREVTEDDS